MSKPGSPAREQGIVRCPVDEATAAVIRRALKDDSQPAKALGAQVKKDSNGKTANTKVLGSMIQSYTPLLPGRG